MPELPEVETVVRHLNERFHHAIIEHVEVSLPRLIHTPLDHFHQTLSKTRIDEVTRRGKYILIHLNNGHTLVSHLRMEGKYREHPTQSSSPSPYAHLRFYLQDGRRLDYEDVRTFGTFEVVKTRELMRLPSLKKLGPEPLTLTDPHYLYHRFQSMQQAIKPALLDQTVLAGIGNIYADEVLFATEIHPLTLAKNLSLFQCEMILDAIKRILNQAIEDGGTRIRSYQSGMAIDGQFALRIHAYGQTGKACSRCYHRIHKITVAGRGTHFCPTCQHDPRLPYVVGVTGSIASGKSTLLDVAQRRGFYVIKADDIVKKMYGRKSILNHIQQSFGKAFVIHGTLQVEALLHYLTQSSSHRLRYEKWLHPLVKAKIQHQLFQSKKPLVLIEIPLLFQSHSDVFCDEVIAIDAPSESRFNWLRKRNGNKAEALWTLAETNDWSTYQKHIDIIYENNLDYAQWLSVCETIIDHYTIAADGK